MPDAPDPIFWAAIVIMSSEYPISDIIDGFRLPTTQYGQFAVGHIVSWSDPAPGSENVLYMRHGPPLGKGQYGEIYLEQAPNPTARAPKTRAVKEVNKTFSELHKIDWKREIEALVILSQPQVSQPPPCGSVSIFMTSQYKPFFVDFFGWYDDSDIVYLAMEYFDLKDLSEHLNDILDEEDIRTIARQITQGLNIMHEHGIVHRDLKPKVRSKAANTLTTSWAADHEMHRTSLSLLKHLSGTSRLPTLAFQSVLPRFRAFGLHKAHRATWRLNTPPTCETVPNVPIPRPQWICGP